MTRKRIKLFSLLLQQEKTNKRVPACWTIKVVFNRNKSESPQNVNFDRKALLPHEKPNKNIISASGIESVKNKRRKTSKINIESCRKKTPFRHLLVLLENELFLALFRLTWCWCCFHVESDFSESTLSNVRLSRAYVTAHEFSPIFHHKAMKRIILSNIIPTSLTAATSWSRERGGEADVSSSDLILHANTHHETNPRKLSYHFSSAACRAS